MRRLKALLGALLLAAGLSGCGLSGDTLTVVIPKIGKADCSILKNGNESMVIDCGEAENAPEILDTLQKQNISTLQYLVITHFDKDHVGGAAEVLRNIPVEQVLEPDYSPENPQAEAYRTYREALAETGVPVTKVRDTLECTLGSASITVTGSGGQTYSKNVDNNSSLLVAVTHRGNRFLFAGDIEKQRITELLDTGIPQYDFLKVPHHGVYNSALPDFLEAVGMEYAVITCSNKNPADAETLEALRQAGAKTYETSQGPITVVSTDAGIKIRQ